MLGLFVSPVFFKSKTSNFHFYKEPTSIEIYSIPCNYLIHTLNDFIQTKFIFISHTTNVLYTNGTVDDKSQYLKNPRK